MDNGGARFEEHCAVGQHMRHERAKVQVGGPCSEIPPAGHIRAAPFLHCTGRGGALIEAHSAEGERILHNSRRAVRGSQRRGTAVASWVCQGSDGQASPALPYTGCGGARGEARGGPRNSVCVIIVPRFLLLVITARAPIRHLPGYGDARVEEHRTEGQRRLHNSCRVQAGRTHCSSEFSSEPSPLPRRRPGQVLKLPLFNTSILTVRVGRDRAL